MKKLYRVIIPLALGFVLFSCGSDEPGIVITVDFSTDPAIIEVGVPVKFVNNSENGEEYEWDFGDGQVSSDASPTITYDDPGTYTVKLVVINGKKMEELEKVIDVGERNLVGFTINSVSFVNNTGGDWDDSVEVNQRLPDLSILILNEDFSDGISTPQFDNLSPNLLPIPLSVSGGSLVLTDEEWTIVYYDFDYDGEDGIPDNDDDFEVMAAFTFNPVLISSDIENDGTGSFEVNAGAYEVTFFFEID